MENKELLSTKEFEEREEVYQVIKGIIASNKGPFYFIDLHTTSSETKPFITISDSLNNRKFSKAFSIPTVLGIEEFLDGPLLTYINEFGHIALGFEAGAHYKDTSIEFQHLLELSIEMHLSFLNYKSLHKQNISLKGCVHNSLLL